MSRYLGLFLVLSVSAFADQTVKLKAGSDITLEQLSEKTRVACEGDSTASKCFCEYSASYYTPLMLISREKIKLGAPDSKQDCFAEIASNPACK